MVVWMLHDTLFKHVSLLANLFDLLLVSLLLLSLIFNCGNVLTTGCYGDGEYIVVTIITSFGSRLIYRQTFKCFDFYYIKLLLLSLIF